MTDKVSGDGVAYVDHDYYWRPINEAPHGVKLQLHSDHRAHAQPDLQTDG